jgi:hypothetical protein
MTSTYLPFRPFFAAPARLLAVGAPSRSSISLALLILVGGLLGGRDNAAPAVGGAPTPGVLALLAIGGSNAPPAADGGGTGGGGPRLVALGGAVEKPADAGAGLALALGGGGVAAGAALTAEPSALLTHRFRFSSKTSVFSPPSLALYTFLPPSSSAPFLPANQPPNQPALPCCSACALARAALDS